MSVCLAEILALYFGSKLVSQAISEHVYFLLGELASRPWGPLVTHAQSEVNPQDKTSLIG